MTTRDTIISALNGEAPERIPLTTYHGMESQLLSPDVFAECQAKGLGVVHHAYDLVEWEQHGVRIIQEDSFIDGKEHWVTRYETPVGNLEQRSVDRWHQEYFIKKDSDYNIMRWIVEHTEVKAHPERLAAHEAEIGENGLCMPAGVWAVCDETGGKVWEGLRTPYMKMCVDWVSMEKFCMDAALETPEMIMLYDAMRELYKPTARAFAQGDSPVIKLFENLTIPMVGPERYRKFLSPAYDDWADALDPAGKKLCVHFDGLLNAVSDDIAGERFSVIESLTEPPEGDMGYEACRVAWPDKVIWANFCAETFKLSGEQLKDEVRRMVQCLGRKGLLFEFSEHLPVNGDELVPLILEVLSER